MEKEYSYFKYKFVSLKSEEGRKEVNQIIKRQKVKTNIVKFDYEQPPLFPNNNESRMIYFMHRVEQDVMGHEMTSIIKLYTNNLSCQEIYNS